MNEEKDSPRLEINVPMKSEVVRLPDWLVVRRTTYNTGSVAGTILFPGDHPDARQVK